MESLSRTTSRESVTSNEKSQARSPSRDMQDLAATDMSRPPSPSNAFEPNQPLAATSRVPSHSLLPAFQNAAVPSRKSRFADVGTIGENIGRASVSMPPPATKSSSIYKPSTVRRPTASQNAMENKDGPSPLDGAIEETVVGSANGMEELERTASAQNVLVSEPHSPLGFVDSGLKPAASTLNKPGDRLSFSSLYSLSSAIHNGATGITSAPQSTASSTAGSIKSVEQFMPTVTQLSPSLGSARGEATSSATTATDPVSVIANSQASHQGLRSISSLKAVFAVG